MWLWFYFFLFYYLVIVFFFFNDVLTWKIVEASKASILYIYIDYFFLFGFVSSLCGLNVFLTTHRSPTALLSAVTYFPFVL